MTHWSRKLRARNHPDWKVVTARRQETRGRSLFSNKVFRRLRKSFRKTFRFFQLYRRLRAYYQDVQPAPKRGFYDEFRDAMRDLVRKLPDKDLKGYVRDVSHDLRRQLRKLDEGRGSERSVLRRAIDMYADIIFKAAKSREIYLKRERLRSPGWVRFELMRPEERKMEKLKERDPELYELAEKENEVREKLDKFIQDRLRASGYEVEKREILNKPVNTGVQSIGDSGVGRGGRDERNSKKWYFDEIPGLNPEHFDGEAIEFKLELQNGETYKIDEIGDGYIRTYGELPDIESGRFKVHAQEAYILDEDEEMLTEDEYREKRKRHLRSISKLSKTVDYDLEDLHSVDEGLVDRYRENQEVEKKAITDDTKKQKAVTRIYPTVEIHGETVIAEGKFKGVFLRDMVNRMGRMIEGTAYDYNPDLGRPVSLENRQGDELEVDLYDRDEPYITQTEGCELYVRIPSKNGYWTDVRNNVYELSEVSAYVEYLQDVGSRREAFLFQPREFDAVRDALGSCSLSTAAMECVKNYYEKEKRLEEATDKSEYEDFSADALGGFEEDFDFWTKQKQALSWLDENGDQGLMAADTGTGKCLTGDTLVETNKGTVSIEDMNPGLTKAGSYREIDGWEVCVDGKNLPVKGFYYDGKKQTNRVKTRKGFEVEGSQVHPLLAVKNEWLEFVETQNIEPGDWVAIHRSTAGSFPDDEPELKMPDEGSMEPNAQTFDVPSKMSPDLGRLFAYIIAEGWTNDRMYFKVSQCPEKNPKMHSDIVNLLERHLKPIDASSLSDKDKCVSSVYIREYLNINGIPRATSKDKEVPDCILRSTRETVRQFLKVMFSCEGHVSERGCCEFYSASKKLTKQIQILLLKFGIVSSRSTKQVEEKDYYRLFVSGDDACAFRKRIGFVREDQKEAFDEAQIGDSVNHDTIPNDLAGPLVGYLKEAIERSTDVGLRNVKSGVSTSLRTTMSNTVHQGRGLSYRKLQELVELYDSTVDEEHHYPKLRSILQDLIDRKIYFDKVESVEESCAEIMDIEVDHHSHTFIGNGFYNHNTAMSVGYIQNLMRKEILYDPDEQSVLFVHPSSLEGNIESEVKSLVDNPPDILEYLETMTYWKFSRVDEDYIDQYEAVLFDEASKLKNKNSQRSINAQREHPRKVLLTASPVERDPKEAFTLSAIANNEDLQSKEGLKKRRQFLKRYCEKIGSRTVGITDDPQAQRDLDSWIRRNMFHVDKEAVEEADLPDLVRQNENVAMPEQMEEVYREKSEEIEDVLRGMVRLYRDRDKEADDPEITGAISQLSSIFAELQELSNQPEKFIDGMNTNPKLERAFENIKQRVDQNRRTVLWTDSKDYAEKTARYMSREFAGLKHAYGTPEVIEVLKNGEVVNRYTKRYYEDDEGNRVSKDRWRQFILDNKVNPVGSNIFTCTLTKSYSHGFNLYDFAQVIHLDRNDWNAETMKQRTARVWRSGQDEEVQEINLDMTYSEPEDEYDRTADEIRKYLQEMDEELFDALIVETQQDAEMPEFFDIEQMPSSLFKIKRDLLELAASPVLENHAELRNEIQKQVEDVS